MNVVDIARSPENQSIWTSEAEVNYPRNCWWVAAFAEEITTEPVARWLLDRPVVLYRKADGGIVALDNRCPHRWAPLSAGKIIGDEIQCPYHGLQFLPNGQCSMSPTQSSVPPKSTIHAYPVIESDPFIWIWMGDPARIGEFDPPPDTSWHARAVNPHHGVMEIDCNYMLLHDNVMDLTHFAFVHANSLEFSEWIKPPKVTTSGNTVTYRQELTDWHPTPSHTFVTGIPREKALHSVTQGNFLSPAIHFGGENITDPNPEPGQRAEFTLFVCHAPTPISMNKMRYHFIVGWDVEIPAGASLGEGVGVIFDEDKRILEMVQEMVNRDGRGGRNFPETHLQADTGQLHARRKLQEWLDRE